MVFSNTSEKNGLIQHCEQLCLLGDAGISGDATLLKLFTAGINRAYDEVLPILFRSDRTWQWDDENHTDFPIATTNIVSGQRDYTFVADENGNSILKILSVAVKQTATTSDYTVIYPKEQKVGTYEGNVLIEANSANTGVPNGYDKFGSSVLLDPVPNYNATAGIQATFQRTPNYFTSTDTTQSPGIPAPFQSLLSLIASHEWVATNKVDSVALSRIEAKITQKKADLATFMQGRERDQPIRIRPRIRSSE